jgi:hypothetical protein
MKPIVYTVVLPMIVGFTTTLGIVGWERGHEPMEGDSRPPPQQRPHAGANKPASGFASWLQPAQSEPRPPAHSTSTRSSAPVTDAPKPAALESLPELPVQLSYHRRPRLNQLEASLTNRSAETLTIAADISHPGASGTTPIQLRVPPYGMTQFGVEQGLRLQGGDQIKLTSPPYAEMSVQIP